MIDKPTFDELNSRIEKNVSKFKDDIPREVIVCWDGYIGALLEWGQISVEVHDKLHDLLPAIDESPIIDIMLGN